MLDLLPGSTQQLPNSEESERAVLAALLLQPALLGEVAAILRPEDFFLERHEVIYRTALGLDGPLDIRTLQAALEAAGEIDRVGGVAYLAALDLDLPDLGRIEAYAGIVKERSVRRKAIELGGALIRASFDGSGTDAATTLSEHHSALVRLLADGSPVAWTQLGEVAVRIAAEYAAVQAGSVLGVSTGFGHIDQILGGLKRGDLVILGGRPGMGKTSLLGQWAESLAEDEVATAFFSLEMTAEELAARTLSRRIGVSVAQMASGHLSKLQKEGLAFAATQVARWGYLVDDRPGKRLAQICAAARALAAKPQGLRVLMVDHLGLVRPDRRRDSRVVELDEISMGLKDLAKELGITVVALSQLSRECERRADKRPILADLRDSGAVEQNADVVCFLYRPAVYEQVPDDQAELIVAKHRSGPTGVVELGWSGKTMSFNDRRATP